MTCATPPAYLGMPAIVVSPVMLQVLDMVQRVGQTNATVLITGESGVGKELVARAVHHHSLRCHKSWVDVSCAALPEHLVESELFGYEKGAFSGADGSKPGLFELANNGTLFLDEIGELEPRMQVKLLRVLDGTPYYRLGGIRKVSVDVRIVAATNQNLEEMVRSGSALTISCRSLNIFWLSTIRRSALPMKRCVRCGPFPGRATSGNFAT